MSKSENARRLWADPTHRERVSAALRARWQDPAYREHHTQVVREQWSDPETKAKMVDGLNRPETKQRISEASTEMWADPDHRLKLQDTNWAGRHAWLDGQSHHGPMMDDGLRTLFHDNLPFVHWVAIESGLTGRGIPDSNGGYNGADFWVEYKWTEGWNCPLRPEQVAWLFRRARQGCRAFIATRRHCTAGPKRPAADELWIHHGLYARELKAGGLRAVPPLMCAAGGPRNWPWDEVIRVLTKGGP